MATVWHYFGVNYSTEEEANQGVVDRQDRLENNPTDWVVVKKLSKDAKGRWIIPTDTLTDQEINNLDASFFYSVASIIEGDFDLGLNSEETTLKIAEHRNVYTDFFLVNELITMIDDNPAITKELITFNG
tara:strand:- start:98 stop:487 length:390 start_codon:yes stop_codon:yes gene_type:complete